MPLIKSSFSPLFILFYDLYTAPKWLLSGNITPLAGGLHSCFYRKISDNVQMGVELEGSLRNQECTGTIAYQIEVPTANITCKGNGTSVEINHYLGQEGFVNKNFLLHFVWNFSSTFEPVYFRNFLYPNM